MPHAGASPECARDSQRADCPRIATIIDAIMLAAINTPRPIPLRQIS
jgi:hypothetical protein